MSKIRDRFLERLQKSEFKKGNIHGEISPDEELITHPDWVETVISQREILFAPKLPSFDIATPLKLIRVKSNYWNRLGRSWFLRKVIKEKIKGMAIISRYLFSNEIYQKIQFYNRKARYLDDYGKLLNLERTQAKIFWHFLKPYMRRRGIDFEKRFYKNHGLNQMDLFNYRLNAVGNRLRNRTLENIGFGKFYFGDTKVVHKTFSSLDTTEAIRPLLYLLVIRSLSASWNIVVKIADNIIDRGVSWANDWIAHFSSDCSPPKNLSFHKQCVMISKELRANGVIRGRPFARSSVTKRFTVEGMVQLFTSSKEGRSGERIHRWLLSQYQQPIVFPKLPEILDLDCISIIAEPLITSKLGTLRGKPDIVIFGSLEESIMGPPKSKNSVLLVGDLKTYDRKKIKYEDLEISSDHVYQISANLDLLKEHGFESPSIIKCIIFADRNRVVTSLTPYLQWVLEYHRDIDIVSTFEHEDHENSQIKMKVHQDEDWGVKIFSWI